MWTRADDAQGANGEEKSGEDIHAVMVAQVDGGDDGAGSERGADERRRAFAVAPQVGGDVEGEGGVQAGEDVHTGNAVLDDGDKRWRDDAACAAIGMGGEGGTGSGQKKIADEARAVEEDEAVEIVARSGRCPRVGVAGDAAEDDGVEAEIAGGEQVGEMRVRFIAEIGGQNAPAPEMAVNGSEQGVRMPGEEVTVDAFQQRENKPGEEEKIAARPVAAAVVRRPAPEQATGGKQRQAAAVGGAESGTGGKDEDGGKQGEVEMDEGAVHGQSMRFGAAEDAEVAQGIEGKGSNDTGGRNGVDGDEVR